MKKIILLLFLIPNLLMGAETTNGHDCGVNTGAIGQGGKEYCTGNEKIDNAILNCFNTKSLKYYEERSKELVEMGEYLTADEVPWYMGVSPGVLDSLAEQCFQKFSSL